MSSKKVYVHYEGQSPLTLSKIITTESVDDILSWFVGEYNANYQKVGKEQRTDVVLSSPGGLPSTDHRDDIRH